MGPKIKHQKKPSYWPLYYFRPEGGGPEVKKAHPVTCSLCHCNLLRRLPFAFCRVCPFLVCASCGSLLDKADTDLHKMILFSTKRPLRIDVESSVDSHGVKVVKIDGYYGGSPRLCRWPVYNSTSK